MSPAAGPAVELADTASRTARDHADVVDLDGGLAGEFATYGLGRRVPGVRVDREPDGRWTVRLRLVAKYGRPLPDIGDEVRARVGDALATEHLDAVVQVHVADIAPREGPTT
ncbi:MAG: Asp23/Gls24 family envelope stress response protein [Acidimicrobiales bacterium]|nr:Asp23/Gls24 family envelope stress response protein [Acidimicrobiales bacterium]